MVIMGHNGKKNTYNILIIGITEEEKEVKKMYLKQ